METLKSLKSNEDSQSVPWKPVLIFVLFTIGVLILFLTYYNSQKTRIFSEQKDNLQSVAILKLNQIESWSDERIGNASAVRDNEPINKLLHQFINLKDPKSKSDLQKWMKAISQYDYSDILVLDTTLFIRLSHSNRGSGGHYEYGNEVYNLFRSKAVQLTDMQRKGNILYIDLLIPLIDKNNATPQLFGILVLRIDPAKKLFPLISLWPTSSKSSESLLFRKDGDSILYLNELRHKSNTALNLKLPRNNKLLLAEKALSGQSGFVEGIDYRGVPVVGYVSSLPHMHWFMVTKTDKAELLAPVKEYFRQSFFIILLILIICLILFINWQRNQKNKAALRKSVIDKQMFELENKFSTAFQRSPVSVGIILQSNNQFIDVNDTFSKDTGYSRDEVLGKTTLELNFWFEDEEWTWILNELSEKRNVSGKVLRFRTKAGELMYGMTSISVINVNGEPCDLITVVNITETKKSEQQLQESETLYRNLFENMLNGFAFCKMLREEGKPLDFLYLKVNKAFVNLTGLNDVEGKRVSEIIPDIQKTDQELLQRYNRVSLTGDGETFETYVESLKMWFLVSVYCPQKDHFVAVFDVITERKESEATLRESEDKFKYVFDHSVIGKSITLPTGEVHVNNAFCTMTGYSAEELSTLKWQDVTHPDDIEMTQGIVNKLLTGKTESVRFTKRYIKKDGSVLWAEVSSILRHNEKGNPLYFMTAIHDITDRKQAEDILKNDEKRLRDIIESLPQLFWTCLPEGPCDYLSTQWIEYTGIPEKIQLGYGWLEQLHPDDRERVNTAWKEKVKSGEVFDLDFRIRRNDNVYHWFQTRAVPIRNRERTITKWLGSNTDIDSIRKAEAQLINYSKNLEQSVKQRTQQLESANKELEAFTYSVSHDLRAPLRAVHGFTKILKEDYGQILDEEGLRICNVITSSANQMSELIDDLLSFSRIGRSSMNNSVLNMKEMADNVVSELISLERITLVKIKIGKLSKVTADANLIRHVWRNLISNAIKYTSRQASPQISINSIKDGSFITYAIKDNGVGFDMQYANKLFGVFQRLHSEKEFEGNGVGLAIVQRIISRHGGKVWAESDIGKGATFYFSLPVDGIASEQ